MSALALKSAYRLDPEAMTYRRVDGDVPEVLSGVLGMKLVIREGTYQGISGPWLRLALPDGTLLPTGAERAARAEQERDQVAQERDQVVQERDRLLALLQANGIDPSRT